MLLLLLSKWSDGVSNGDDDCDCDCDWDGGGGGGGWLSR